MRIPRPILAVSLAASLAVAAACAPGPSGAPEPDRAAFAAGTLQFPGDTWPTVVDPTELGWSSDGLARARRHYDELDSAALLVVHRGVPIVSWGDVDKRYTAQSVRKSLLGALIGQEIASGRLSLDATLAELGIDDSPPALTATEKQATVEDLLRSRSGIFHSALYEAGSWKRHKPERSAWPPGAAWYYNNWDFNALGTIFERSAGRSIGEAFQERIAAPLHMQDFRPGDVVYLSRDSWTERGMHNDSLHRAYIFRISTRDLARFGLLILGRGRWGDRQVVPATWIEATMQGLEIDWPTTESSTRYGYLWWIYPETSWLGELAGTEVWLAQGARGHWLAVVPSLDLVFAHQVATGGVGLFAQLGRRVFGSPAVDDRDLGGLLAEIIAAHPDRAGAPRGATVH